MNWSQNEKFRFVTFGHKIVAQSVRVPNSNRKVASSMPALGITRCFDARTGSEKEQPAREIFLN